MDILNKTALKSINRRQIGLFTLSFALFSLLTTSCGVLNSISSSSNDEQEYKYEPGNKNLLMISTANNTTNAIYSFSVDLSMTKADHIGAFVISSPTSMSLDQKNFVLYTASASAHQPSITATAIDKTSGELHLINSTPTLGALPISIAEAGSSVITANYGNGSITLVKCDKDGALGAPDWRIDLGKKEGSAPNKVIISPDKKSLMVSDKGLDKIFVFRLSQHIPPLSIEKASAKLPKGSEPIDMTFDPSGRYLYVLGGELPTIYTFSYLNRKLSYLYSTPLVATGILGKSILISRDGKYLYALYSNNQLIIYKRVSDGSLQRVGVETIPYSASKIKISPDGKYIAVVCQKSDRVIFYDRNKSNGQLAQIKLLLKLSKPNDLLWTIYK